MPKVSVIIPNYNHAPFLNRRIDSVLNQTYRDFEVIILDDCSPDNSKEIIEGYRGNPKVSHIIYNEINSGSTFKQWEKGILVASGEYIWIAESDDWCEIILLENLVVGIEAGVNCIISYCQSYCIFNNERIKFQSNHVKLSEYIDGFEFIKSYILPRNPIFNASMALWRKSSYSLISKEFTNFRLYGDYLFWIELSTLGKVFVSAKLLNYFRTHDKNVSSKAFKDGLNFVESMQVLKRLLSRNIIDKIDYDRALKRNYYSFKLIQKSLQKESSTIIQNLFSSSSTSILKLNFFYFQKQLQALIRRLFHL